jgi:beta-lactamase superfamily II metal-dependent hydrolase
MKVTFKDVGQGDSIIIEWDVDGIPKVGIIDCKRNKKSNPVIQHISDKYKEIEFIILSHPHSDHYTGFPELLSFIETNKILVNRFGFTIKEIGTKFWNWFEITSDETKVLEDIVKGVRRLRDELGLLKKIVPIEEDWSIPLGNGIEIRCIAPSFTEIEKYQRQIKLGFAYDKQASKAANYLSTIFWLKDSSNNILLTSDAVKEVFERIHNESRFKDVNFIVCQAPHHGSYNCYSDIFWDNLIKPEDRKVVISSGLHETYCHPHLATIKEFEKNGYTIYPTNIVYGVQEYLDELSGSSLVLDMISEIDTSHICNGDKEFIIN